MDTSFARNAAEYRTWLTTITHTHQRRIEVTLLDLEHRVMGSLTADPVFIEGEVTIDVTREVARVLTFKVLDIAQALTFEPDSPSTIPIQYSRMVQVRWLVRVPSLGLWMGPTVFTGRVADFDREGAVVSITAEGKERLSLGQAGAGRVFPKKAQKTRVLRELLSDSGETRMSVPAQKATLPERLTIRSMDTRWPAAKKLAASLNRSLFYDGYGTALLRPLAGKSCFTFDRLTLASEVGQDRDPAGLRNRFIVLGPKPSGKKKRVHADLSLPPKHHLSPRSLGRNGKPYFLIEQTENEHLKTNAEANARAVKLRDEHLRSQTTYSFDALPIPHLEENDLVQVVTPTGTHSIRMRTWTLPLGIDGAPTMSVGSLKRTTVAGRLGRAKGHRGGNGGRGKGRGQGRPSEGAASV